MPEPINEGPSNSVPPEQIVAAKTAWDSLDSGNTSVAERRTRGMLVERGIMPIAGGSDEEPMVLGEKAVGVRDIETVFNLPPAALTQEARSFLLQTAKEIDEKDGKVEVNITEELRQVLIQNGISEELITRYHDNNPEILLAMLVARAESYRIFQRDANAPPIDFEKEIFSPSA